LEFNIPFQHKYGYIRDENNGKMKWDLQYYWRGEQSRFKPNSLWQEIFCCWTIGFHPAMHCNWT